MKKQQLRDALTVSELMADDLAAQLAHFQRLYGRASATIGEQRGTIARLRAERDDARRRDEVHKLVAERASEAGKLTAGTLRATYTFGPATSYVVPDPAAAAEVVLARHWPVSIQTGQCYCGWRSSGGTTWVRHVAEQLAAVGALR